MSDARVTVAIESAIAVVTLENEASRNALTVAMVDQFHELCDRLGRDDAVGAVVVRGAGGHFCAGLDRAVIEVQREDPAGSEAFERAGRVYGAFTRLGELPVPTFCAVRGAAVGAGLNLAMAADLRVVAHDARLTAGFTRLGLHPGGGFFSLATRLLGRDAAVALGVAGEQISGRDAAALGFAWRSVDDTEVETVTMQLASRVAADPALARATIASFREEAGPPAIPWSVAVEVERGRQAWTFRRLAEQAASEVESDGLGET